MSSQLPSFKTAALLLSISGISPLCFAATLPADSALPVQFTRTIDANKARPGDSVTAKTIQAIVLADGQTLPKGATLLGHVVEAHAFVFNPAPYAVQTPSALAIHFDSLQARGTSLPVSLEVRALADDRLSQAASTPHYLLNDTGIAPTIDQIGGDQYAPAGSSILSAKGDIVGYNRKQGAFAHLISNVSPDGSFTCNASTTEQPVAIFSASACGLYGFGSSASLSDNGQATGGTFRVESIGYNVSLSEGSSALLQVIGTSAQAALPTE